MLVFGVGRGGLFARVGGCDAFVVSEVKCEDRLVRYATLLASLAKLKQLPMAGRELLTRSQQHYACLQREQGDLNGWGGKGSRSASRGHLYSTSTAVPMGSMRGMSLVPHTASSHGGRQLS